MKTWAITSDKEALRRKRIARNNAKYWLGKKRPELSEKRMGANNPMYGKKASKETRVKMSESHRKRLKDHQYTDPLKTRTAYIDVHKWVQRYKGRAKFCEHCLTREDRMYHWANVSGHYLRELDDWVRLCVPCHRQYDKERLQ